MNHARITLIPFVVLSLAMCHERVARGDFTFKTIANLDRTNGSFPYGGVTLDSRGNIYGTALSGGPSNAGTVFTIATGTSMITSVASFNGTNGSLPMSSLTSDAQGNLYGTTSSGGASNDGTVFKIAAGTGVISTLATFNGINGTSPMAGVTIDPQGNIYGTTAFGGINNLGTVFKIAAGTGVMSTLATFDGTNGNSPRSTLTLDAQGNLYGTTISGGGQAANGGTVFEIAAGTGKLSTLASFGGNSGFGLYGGVTLDAQKNLYGTTFGGGSSNDGTVFKIAAGTNLVSTIASFNGFNGLGPEAGLTVDSLGNLYGTTNGFAGINATVFEVAAGTNAISTIATLLGTSSSSPAFIYSGLTLDGSGNLFGATESGGSSDAGYVFELSNNATVPEPGSLLVLAQAAVVGLGFLVRARAKQSRRFIRPS